ncbi:hypothetical protein B9Z55_003590 [Caenorhabditis nigoni]|uniref:PAN-3 domain-containing protein n=1 Tax=Caenorhabditis nigoni TaxID=1611254 RepID=A0A2G5VR53_9PELO|nr:hypothetical protein B9Z55_003590 [Caenorhabditis nigoni]
MRYRLLIPILTLFLIQTNASDVEYKFVVVSGEPVTLNASETVQVANFDECTDKCEQKTECVLAYQSNSSDPCYLFDWNSITQIIKNEAGGNGTTAFKVYTDQPACELNAAHLLNGKTYPLFPNDTVRNLWRIDTAEDGWTITYIDAKPTENLICGNFTHDRPYKDGCNPECNVTMVQLLAIPGPLTAEFSNEAFITTNTWEECLYYCYDHPSCFVVWFNPNLVPICRWYSINIIFFLNRTEASEMGGQHLAIKLPLSQKSCSYTTEELMDDKYYWPFNKIYQFFDRSFFRIRTTPKYYKISVYSDEKKSRSKPRPAGCEINTHPSVLGRTGEETRNPAVCGRYKKANVTYAAAKEICQEWDGELATERFYGYFSNCLNNVDMANIPLMDEVFSGQYARFGVPGYAGIKVWVGLEKDSTTQRFKWAREDWVGTNGVRRNQCPYDHNANLKMTSIPYTWGANQPDMTPGNDCAYMTITDAQTLFPGYALSTSRCDVATTNGFACQTRPQQEKGIPKFDDVVREYGQDPALLPEPGDGYTFIQVKQWP